MNLLEKVTFPVARPSVSDYLGVVELLICCSVVLALVNTRLVGRDVHLLNSMLHDFAAEVKVAPRVVGKERNAASIPNRYFLILASVLYVVQVEGKACNRTGFIYVFALRDTDHVL